MEWIIICNPKDYDIKAAFNKLNRINWRQNNNIEINDSVYIYVGSPVGALKYKCIVNKVNLELPEINDDQFVLNS